MDALPNHAQFPCNISVNTLIDKLMLFCSASPLSGETKSTCISKRVQYHYALCRLIENTNTNDEVFTDITERTPSPGIILRIKNIYDVFGEYLGKDLEQICKDIKAKEPNFLGCF